MPFCATCASTSGAATTSRLLSSPVTLRGIRQRYSRRRDCYHRGMRVLVAALLVAVRALGALYAFGLPPFGPREPAPPPVPEIFPVVETGDPAHVAEAIAGGADVHARNEAGLTPLMVAIASNAPTQVAEELLAAGAD